MLKDNAKLTFLMDQFQDYFSSKKYVTFGYLFFIYYQISDSCRYAETIDQYVNGLKIKAKFVIFVQHDAWQTPHKTIGMTRYLAYERENKNIQQVKPVLSLNMKEKKLKKPNKQDTWL